MRIRKLIVVAVIGLLAAVLTTVWILRRTAPAFDGTVAIIFTERSQPEKRITLTDSKEVERLLATIRLKRKKPCSCSHVHEVTFEKPTERLEVSFCDHCFSVLGPRQHGWYPNVRDYWMPKEFYAEFRRLVLSRTNESWYVRP